MPSITVKNDSQFIVKIRTSDNWDDINAQQSVWARGTITFNPGETKNVVFDKKFFGAASKEALYEYGEYPKVKASEVHKINGEKKNAKI